MSDNETEKARPEGDEDEISLVDLAATLWRRKWLIVAVTAIAAVLSVVYALSKPNMFTATSTMLPISGSSSSMLSQYAGLASLAGVSLPGASASDPTVKLQAILNSRSFAEKLVTEMNLVPVLIEHPEKIKGTTPLRIATDSLQKGILSVSVDAKTSLIKISAKTKDPTLSRDIANKAVDLIQADLVARTLSASGKNIVLLEQQVADQEQKVRTAQNKLTAYQRKNKLVAPEAQSAGGLQLYQTLIQQKITMEIEISRLGSALSADNPKLVAAQTQLDAVKKQIADFEKTGGGVGPSMSQAPATMMEYANLTAELELATKIYGGLLSGLENMRLQEASDKLFVEVIDRAVAPEKKSEPSRSMICVVGTMAGAFLSVLLAFVLDAMKKLLADPEVRAKFAGGGKKPKRASAR
ncbi:MAG: GumC family protein [Spirochaetales bacterium]